VARARTVAARVRAGRPDDDPSLVGKALGEPADDARLVLGELDRLATVRAPQAASVSLALAGLAPPESARGSRSAIVTACRDDGALLVDAIASVQALGPSAPPMVIADDGSTDPFTVEVLDALGRLGHTVLRLPARGLS